MAGPGYGESNNGFVLLNLTAAYTAKLADCGKFITAYGANAAFDVTIPAGSTLFVGWSIGALCNAASTSSVAYAPRLRVTSPDKIYLPGTTTAAGGAITQTGSGRTNGGLMQIVYTGNGTWWWGFGYPYDWSAIA